jgi:Flp pilus assembly protein TadG
MQGSRKNREGAAMVESCIVMVLLCLILYGILQVSLVTAASDVLIYAASAGARCATIGYDDTMVEKTVRIAAMANMGPKRIGLGEEMYRIQEYLTMASSAADKSLLNHIDDEYWNSLEKPEYSFRGEPESGELTMELSQRYPLAFPMVGAIYNRNYTDLSTDDLDLRMEDHAGLYLYD